MIKKCGLFCSFLSGASTCRPLLCAPRPPHTMRRGGSDKSISIPYIYYRCQTGGLTCPTFSRTSFGANYLLERQKRLHFLIIFYSLFSHSPVYLLTCPREKYDIFYHVYSLFSHSPVYLLTCPRRLRDMSESRDALIYPIMLTFRCKSVDYTPLQYAQNASKHVKNTYVAVLLCPGVVCGKS